MLADIIVGFMPKTLEAYELVAILNIPKLLIISPMLIMVIFDNTRILAFLQYESDRYLVHEIGDPIFHMLN